jgi:hypothetical protein
LAVEHPTRVPSMYSIRIFPLIFPVVFAIVI